MRNKKLPIIRVTSASASPSCERDPELASSSLVSIVDDDVVDDVVVGDVAVVVDPEVVVVLPAAMSMDATLSSW